MSQKLINHSPDLQRLRSEGFEIYVDSGYIIMNHVPYVNNSREVRYGALASQIQYAGDRTGLPTDHKMYFIGQEPCDSGGTSLTKVINSKQSLHISDTLIAGFMLSSKPSGGYKDYYEKFSTYASMFTQHAVAIRPKVTAKTYVNIPTEENESIFKYIDSASTRAGIVDISAKLKQSKIAIIGLGGSGSYVLDMVAKTPVQEIHLYDDDLFQSHNAFRAPGCASVNELRKQPYKVTYYRRMYSKLHNGIITHRVKVTAKNVKKLADCDFVFICVDDNGARLTIAKSLLAMGVPFIDVGMGLEKVGKSLVGLVRTSYCNPAVNDNIPESIPANVPTEDALYDSNIQTNELNALNAILAVIRWKKHCGFYVDLEGEGSSIYTIDGNHMLNKQAGE